MRTDGRRSLDELPLFADDQAIGEALVGEGRANEWPEILATLEAKGFPTVDPLMRGRFVPAVRAFFDYAYGLAPHLPLTPEWKNFDVTLLPDVPAGPAIYFVAGGAFVKIGYSANWLNRVGELQVGCPFRLTVLHVMPGTREDERRLHEEFAGLRTNGEWFHLRGDLLTFIRRQKNVITP